MHELNNIRIVLIHTTHPGNIGAIARAMKNMELYNLYLVNPKIFPHVDTTAMASGADDILQNAVICESPQQALKNCHLIIGTSARKRFLEIELLEDPKKAAKMIATAASSGQEIAIMFGTENYGLTNDELKLCNYHLNIPTNNEFNSLNIAAAVAIIAYEIKMAVSAIGCKKAIAKECSDNSQEQLATFDEMEFFYDHLEKALVQLKFLDPNNPRHLMDRLRRMFGRMRPVKSEMGILRGILSAVTKK